MESKSESTPPPADGKGRSMMPVMVGVGLLVAVFAIIALWPSDDAKKGGGKGGATASRTGGAAGAIAAAGEGEGGVKPRAYDEPQQSRTGARNPAVKLPPVGMAPDTVPQDDKPPVFQNTAEEIAWYEKKLVSAQKNLESRKKFVDRLPAVRERIEKGPDAEKQLEAFEGRSKIVKDNYDRAVAMVAELERKLTELRGS